VTNRAVIPARTVREEIENVLKGSELSISGTPRWIATAVNLPVRVVREELSKMELEGKVKSRTHRSGEVLYRLKDQHDDRWDAHRGLAISTTR
jgi:hypothetical protein